MHDVELMTISVYFSDCNSHEPFKSTISLLIYRINRTVQYRRHNGFILADTTIPWMLPRGSGHLRSQSIILPLTSPGSSVRVVQRLLKVICRDRLLPRTEFCWIHFKVVGDVLAKGQ